MRQIHAKVDIPLAMHGASGLAEADYPKIVENGISKVCYYTAMALGASNDLREMMAEQDERATIYHHLIARATDYFYSDTKRLLDIVGCSGAAP